MKTKYVKVPVSERLPEDRNDVIVIDEYGQSGEAFFMKNEEWHVYNRNVVTGSIEYWLEEVPDHSEEMLSALSEIMRFKHELRLVMSDKLQYPDNFLKALDSAEELLNKVKDNGK
ncbi:hypothetical protein CMU91_15000 [Elizabethkingia anophelis]|nr:hypothetical protein [Elizabethkingia anophelis]